MNIYILEDEVLIQQHLFRVLGEIPYVKIVGFSDTVEKACTEIPQLRPDLILADIRLKDGDSFGLFSSIPVENFQIIFLTAYDEYAVRALNLGALAYLLKPLDENELRAALDKCFYPKENEKFTKNQMEITDSFYRTQQISAGRKIALRSQDYIEVITADEILYCHSDRGYTIFRFINREEIVVTKGLKDYEVLLEPLGFLRCHQSYLVNLNYIKKYFKEGTLQMQNGDNIPVSTRKRDDVLRFLEGLS